MKENQFMSLLPFFCLFTYRFVNSVVTVIQLISYYYQLYKIPNKKQTDFQNWVIRNSHYISMRTYSTCKNFICRKTPSIAFCPQKSQPAITCSKLIMETVQQDRCEICSKLTIKIPERRHWRRSGIFIVNFEHISYLVLVFLLLTLSS